MTAPASPDHDSKSGPPAKAGSAASGIPQEISRKHFFQIFTTVMLPIFIGAIDQTLLATATTTIAADFGSLSATSWLMIAYMLTSSVTVPVYGRLGDRYGRREIMLAALGFFFVGAVVCVLAPTMGWLIAGRAIQGIGGGGLISLSMALIADLVPPRQRASFQGYFSAMFTTANVLGPIIGGVVVTHVSWRWLFVGYAPLLAFAVWRTVKLPSTGRNPRAPGVRDLAGLALFALGISTLLFAFSSAGQRFAWLSWPMAALLVTGITSWVLMFAHARRHAAPFFPVDLLGIPGLRGPVATVLLTAFCVTSLVFYLPIYMQLAMGASAGEAGLLLTPLMLGVATGGVTSGRMMARTGSPQPIPVVGLSWAAVGLAILAVVPPSAAVIAPLGFCIGLGFGPSMPVAQLMAQVAAGRDRIGAAVSIVSLGRMLGSALGTALTGGVLYSLLPDVDIKQVVAGGVPSADRTEIIAAFHGAFLFIVLVAALGAFNASRVPKLKI